MENGKYVIGEVYLTPAGRPAKLLSMYEVKPKESESTWFAKVEYIDPENNYGNDSGVFGLLYLGQLEPVVNDTGETPVTKAWFKLLDVGLRLEAVISKMDDDMQDASTYKALYNGCYDLENALFFNLDEPDEFIQIANASLVLAKAINNHLDSKKGK